MKSLRSIRYLVLAILLVGCIKKEENGATNENYNALVTKYNKLLGTSYDLQLSSEKELALASQMDAEVGKLLSIRDHIATGKNVSEADFQSLQVQYEKTVLAVVNLENEIMQQMVKLVANSGVVYKDGKKNQERLTLLALDRSQILSNIKKLVKAVSDDMAKTRFNRSLPLQSREIQLTERERSIVQNGRNGGGIANTGGNTVSLGNRQDVIATAQRMGLDATAADNAYSISNQTGGIVGLSQNADLLTQTITDIFAHIKASINKNTEDLELVFAIDYSGSMGDDIDAVTTRLQVITDSLVSVQRSGREVRVGIMLFGKNGLETVSLQLTNNMVSVKAKLSQLLNEYPRNQHSDDPGEASFAGLNLSDRFSWSSSNRKIILITDEPARELVLNQTALINQVMAKLRSQGIQTSIYTIVVGS